MKRLHITHVKCDGCGAFTDIYLTSGNLHFCSDACRNKADEEIFDLMGADKFDSERDASIEDTFEDYLNESKEFEL